MQPWRKLGLCFMCLQHLAKGIRQIVTHSKMGRKCERGKPCGATCIERVKICKVDTSRDLSSSLKEASSLLTDKGSKTSNLSKLETHEDVYYKQRETSHQNMENRPELFNANLEVSKILNYKGEFHPEQELYLPGEKAKYEELRKKLGEPRLNDALFALNQYILYPEVHTSIRRIERDDSAYRIWNKYEAYKKMGDSLNYMLTLKEMPKPPVEKFRGFRATPEHLARLLSEVDKKGEFNSSSLASWSSSLRVGRKFADTEIFDNPDRTEKVIFRAINRKGVPVEFVSPHPDREDEILTPRNTNYRYLGYSKVHVKGSGDFYIFDLEELS